jgi:hypothetical protein
MTVRVYLAVVTVLDEPPQPGDIPAERLFIDASAVGEIWVDTEHHSLPVAGRSVTFSFPRPLGIGFERVTGTVERLIDRRSR